MIARFVTVTFPLHRRRALRILRHVVGLIRRQRPFCFRQPMPIISNMTKHQTRPITLEELVAPHSEVDALAEKHELSRADQMLLAALTRCCASESSPLIARQPGEDAECLQLTLLAALSERDDRLVEKFAGFFFGIASGKTEVSAEQLEFRKDLQAVITSCKKADEKLKWAVVFSLVAMLFSTATFVALGMVRSPESVGWWSAGAAGSTTLENKDESRASRKEIVWCLKSVAHASATEKKRKSERGSDFKIIARPRLGLGRIWSWFCGRRTHGAS